MSACEWVLDTWVLQIAQNPLDQRSLDSVVLLREIIERHRIAVDHGRHILGEYFRNLSGGTHASLWLNSVLSRAGRINFRAGVVPRRNRETLLNDLHFDRSDLPFVGVAAEGPDKIIVSEESDYSSEIKAYLRSELGISVLTVHQALDRAVDP